MALTYQNARSRAWHIVSAQTFVFELSASEWWTYRKLCPDPGHGEKRVTDAICVLCSNTSASVDRRVCITTGAYCSGCVGHWDGASPWSAKPQGAAIPRKVDYKPLALGLRKWWRKLLSVQRFEEKQAVSPQKILKPLLSVGLVTAFTLSARHRIMETGTHIKPRPEIGELVNAYTFPRPHVLGTHPESNSCQRGAHKTNHVKKWTLLRNN